MGKIVETSIQLDQEEEQRFQDELRKEANKEVQEMAVTWQEALAESKATGWTEGKATGWAEGKATGWTEGKATGWAEGKAQGWMEGKQEGHMEGEAKGRIYAAHQAIVIAARGRFGSIPATFERRVRADRRSRPAVSHPQSLDEIELRL